MDLSKKIVHNVRYGNGYIEKIEKDLIWVKFEKETLPVCFHLLSAFTGMPPFLKTDDEELLSYIDFLIKDNALLEMKEEAISNLEKLGISETCIDSFKTNNLIYLLEGKRVVPVDRDLLKNIKDYETKENAVAYAVLNIPSDCGEKTERYIFLSIEKYANVKSFIIEGKCCFVRGRIWNNKTKATEYATSIGLQLTQSGIWCMPLSLSKW